MKNLSNKLQLRIAMIKDFDLLLGSINIDELANDYYNNYKSLKLFALDYGFTLNQAKIIIDVYNETK